MTIIESKTNRNKQNIIKLTRKILQRNKRKGGKRRKRIGQLKTGSMLSRSQLSGAGVLFAPHATGSFGKTKSLT